MDRVACRCSAFAVVVVVLAGWPAGASGAVASGWSIQPSPSPARVQTGGLGGVSCVSLTACMAVGSYGNRAGIQVPLAERWDGVGWSIVLPPSPSGSDFSVLGGVSCVSATSCVAVGTYDRGGPGFIGGPEVPFAERWDGIRWSIQPVPSPAGATDPGLSAVSCESSSSCTAVGQYVDANHDGSTLVEHWDGASWSIQQTITITGVAGTLVRLTGVSCPTASFCIAAGSSSAGPLVQRWDGTSWSIQPDGMSGGLTDVSCTSSTECTAVGYHCSCSANTPLVEHWDGANWSDQSTPAIAGSLGANLFHVSCASPSACIATGIYDDAVGRVAGTLVEHWDGTTWSIQPTPKRVGASLPSLAGVSCASPTACIAVGGYQDPAGFVVTLAEALNGGGWSIEPTPNPSGATRSTLTGVSCASATACTAVGTGNTHPLIERWNHGRWSMRQTNGSPGGFTAVSCSSPIACTAVGGALSEHWNGRRWSVQQIQGLDGPLDAVSCTSNTTCTAVAAFSCQDCFRVPTHLPLAARWNGVSWSIQQIGNTTKYPSGLQGISCTSARACTAVGGSTIERWNGRRWSTQQLHHTAASLDAVSCTSKTACIAVGLLNNGTDGMLAERWNGVKWSSEQPALVHATRGSLTGISCTAPNACTAVGAYTSRRGRQRLLVEHWNGTRWSIQPTPVPAGATSSNLTSVSCADSEACTAVGSYTNTHGDELTLMESLNATR